MRPSNIISEASSLFLFLHDMERLRVCSTCARSLRIQKRLYSSHDGRDYNAAVSALNTLQSNFSIVEAIKKLGPGWNKQAIPEMREWIRRIGYEVCVALTART